MRLTIASESPLTADGRTLIAESQAALEEVYPSDEIFSVGAEEIARTATAFLVARDERGSALGCVALFDAGSCGEVKRLFVRRAVRGAGVAQALMRALEAEARGRGLSGVLLETGARLRPAVGLYERLGYRQRGPFGSYRCHPASLFMEKSFG